MPAWEMLRSSQCAIETMIVARLTWRAWSSPIVAKVLAMASYSARMSSTRATRDSVYSMLEPSGAFTVIMNRPSSSSGMKPLSIRLKIRPLTTTTPAAAPTTVQRRRRLAEIKRR